MPPAARPRRRAPEQRPDQVLDAAERVLIERGFDATTIADVAASAGVAKGTVYLYFESKSALLAALRQRYLERFVAALAPSTDRLVLRTRIDRLIDALFEFSQSNGELHRVLFHQAGFSEDDIFAGVRDVVTALVRIAGVRPNQVDATVTFVVHGMHGLLVEGLHDRRLLAVNAAAAKAIVARSLGA